MSSFPFRRELDVCAVWLWRYCGNKTCVLSFLVFRAIAVWGAYMRLSRDDLQKITHRKRPRQQAAWFLQYLGIAVPCDSEGPILTPATYEAVLAKCLGVSAQINPVTPHEGRGTVRLRSVPSKVL
jgi:hypothetical protein